jgi:2-dehydropantoate 2-reductase
MRIAIVGAGAIGGWLAVRLAEAGHQVSALARGRTLEAIESHGLRLVVDDQTRVAKIAASDDPARLGIQDLVVVAVKGYALAAAAPAIAQMLGPDTAVLPAMNGVPWWFAEGLGGPLAGVSLRSVDPNGEIAKTIPVSQVIGCVVHASCALAGPAHVVHSGGNSLIIGEPRGDSSKRVAAIAEALAAGELDVTVSARIQKDIWYKLWGNMTMNPISALTGALTDRILDDALVNAFVLSVMGEAAEIGRRIGCPIPESGEDRMKVTRRLGPIRTSMLQDVEAGRPLEVAALLAAPREIAGKLGVATPFMDALHGLVRLYAATRLSPGETMR